jgi:hypothetical protein
MFIVFLELDGKSKAFQEAGICGGFVTCAVPETDIIEAVKRAKNCLKEDGYVIVDVEKALRFNQLEWEHDQNIVDLVEKSEADDEVGYSDFEVWYH